MRANVFGIFRLLVIGDQSISFLRNEVNDIEAEEGRDLALAHLLQNVHKALSKQTRGIGTDLFTRIEFPREQNPSFVKVECVLKGLGLGEVGSF